MDTTLYVVSAIVVPLTGLGVWVTKTVLSYFFKPGGFVDDIRVAQKVWYAKHAEYMESSRDTQAATAAAAAATASLLEQHNADQKRHVADMVRHDAIMSKQTLESHECLEVIAATQEEHTRNLHVLVRAGLRACDVATRIGKQLELSEENVSAIEEIKQEFREKNGR